MQDGLLLVDAAGHAEIIHRLLNEGLRPSHDRVSIFKSTIHEASSFCVTRRLCRAEALGPRH